MDVLLWVVTAVSAASLAWAVWVYLRVGVSERLVLERKETADAVLRGFGLKVGERGYHELEPLALEDLDVTVRDGWVEVRLPGEHSWEQAGLLRFRTPRVHIERK